MKTINPVPVPVEGVPMQTWSVQVREPRARDIYMRNDSDAEIVVTGVQLYNCRNIKQECKAYQTNVPIPAGKTVKAMRIEQDNLKLSWHYNYNFQMRRNGRVVADTFSVVTTFRTTGMGSELSRASDFRPEVGPVTDGGVCGAQNPVRGPDGTTGLLLVFGSTEDDLRTVTVYRRADGTPVQLVDARNGPGQRRTSISVMLERQIAFMRNVGASGVAEMFYVSGPDVTQAPSLGNPDAIVAHTVQACAK